MLEQRRFENARVPARGATVVESDKVDGLGRERTAVVSLRLRRMAASGVGAFQSNPASIRCRDAIGGQLLVEDCVQRNVDYEMAQYTPGHFMVGGDDDGGGSAILLNLRDRRIHEVDMGVMDERFAELSANSLAELLEIGSSLSERSD